MEKTKISPGSWKASLHRLLNRLAADSGRPPRLAVVGIGNPLRSDDAAGILVAQALHEGLTERDDLLVLKAGAAPENRTGELRSFGPDLVLFIDAADMGEKGGTVAWIPEESIDGLSASTHSLPLSTLSAYLRLELRCEVAVLGIQPVSNEVGEEIHAEVLHAVGEIVRGLKEIIL